MFPNITSITVLWNEEQRMEPLLDRLRTYTPLVVGVQESTDRTLELARQYSSNVVTDKHRGYGDATLPQVVGQVQTRWAFKVDGDELPTVELMESLGEAIAKAEATRKDGVWIRFRSWIEGVEWDAYHGHLRLFEKRLGWPGLLHSRPMTEKTFGWETGWIEHRRSLDEMVRDYLSYLRVGSDNPGWTRHNTEMLWHACVGASRHKGWDFVQSFEWWPEVQAAAFKDGLPDPGIPEL